MNIGQADKASGVSAKMLRHYESIGLIPRALRTESGYRTYDQGELAALRLIRGARDLGMPLARIGRLVGLWRNRNRPSAEVKRIAEEHIAELDAKIAALQAMRVSLQTLVEGCRGDARPDCPILDDLGRGQPHAGHA